MISFAKTEDISAIMDFIDREWRKGHILARDRKLFEWMYVRDNEVHFVVSKEDGGINGILGFIAYDENNSQVDLTMWKAIKVGSGMSMLVFLEEELSPVSITSPGINYATTSAIYKYFGYEVGKMQHYYRLADREEFYIPVINERLPTKMPVLSSAKIHKLNSFQEFMKAGIVLHERMIQKDNWYIRHRYFEHPVFEYIHYLVEGNGKLDVVMREQDVDGHKCIRIVDMLGDFSLLPDFTSGLDNILITGNYEYADCYMSCADEGMWENAGWINVEKTRNIIPNYFFPFVRSNVDIYYCCKPHNRILLRGDGDQDRPN